MKIWRKSRLSECHANLFANGRVRAIYVNIFVMCAAMLSLASCSSDDDYKFDASKLEGKWRKAIRSGIMDGETVIYTFYSENWYSGRIEQQVSAWPDEGWKTTDLNYRVGETGHMNIFTGKTGSSDKCVVFVM